MSISPTSDIADPRRVGQPVRLTPDTGLSRRPDVNAYAESGTLYGTSAPAQGTEGAEGEEMSFWDFLDVINPLQHIPGVSTLYRELTGDEIKAPAKLAGGALYGGVIGLAASAADVILKEVSGRDAGEHIASLFSDEEDAASGDATALADAATDSGAGAGAGVAAASSTAMPAQAAAADKPVVTAANTKWFSINRDQHVRSGEAAPQPVSEATMRGRPTVEVLSPKAVDAPAEAAPATPPAPSLPLGVLSAASVVSAQETSQLHAPAMTPSPEALRKAMAAQGLAANTDHPMLRQAAATSAQAPAAQAPAAQAAAPASQGPVEVPAWFDKAMQRYSNSDRLAPSDFPAMAPAAAPAVRRGI